MSRSRNPTRVNSEFCVPFPQTHTHIYNIQYQQNVGST